MTRWAFMLAQLLALGLCTSLLVAWAGALLDRSAWPDTPLTGTPTGSRTEMRGWLVEEGRDRTLTWRTFGALDLWDEPPDLEAPTNLPAWSVGHGLADQPGPFAPARERTLDRAWEVSAGWPMRCVRAVREAGPIEFALPGEFVRGGAAAMPFEWPIPLGFVDGYDRIAVEPWPNGDLAAALPLRPMPVGLLVNTIVFAVLWFVALLPLVALRAWRRWGRAEKNRCVACGHPRDGLSVGAPCPECGRDPAERTTLGQLLTARAPMLGAALALVLVVASGAALATHRWMAVDRLPPLHHAAAVGDELAIERLVAGGAPVEEPIDGQSGALAAAAGSTALQWAAARGHAGTVRCLLDAGAVRSDGSGAEAPLVVAAVRGELEITERLAEELTNRRPPGALALAVARVDDATRDWALAYFAWDESRLDAAARSALEAHDFELIALLVEAGLDPARREALSLVRHAVAEDARVFDGPHGHDAGITRKLLVQGFDRAPRIIPRVLLEVMNTDNVPAFDALLDAFPGPRGSRAFVHDSALMVAAARGSFRMVERLLDYGLDIDSEDAEFRRAIDYAILDGRPGVVRVLIDRGAELRFGHRRYSARYFAERVDSVRDDETSQEVLDIVVAAEAEWDARERDAGGP